jgi:hypothetical protein
VIVGIVDGQEGRLGSAIIKRLAKRLPAGWELLALGANSCATAAMLKAGASAGASGEGAVVWNSLRCTALAGPLSIVLANSMLGEISPRMAEAVASSPARKFLLPGPDGDVELAGVSETDLRRLVADLAERLAAWASAA